MKKRIFLCVIMIAALLVNMIAFSPKVGAKKLKLSRSKLTLKVGKTYKLKLAGKKKVTWVSSNNRVKVSKKGVVTAKKAGNAKVIAIYKGRAYTCKVKVLASGGATSAKSMSAAKAVLNIVNDERSKVGAKTLKLDSKLCELAMKRAKELTNVFSHTRPNGRSCFTMLKENKVTYRIAAENIAAGQPTPKRVMDGFMASPGHKKNILHKSFRKVGIACYESNGGYGFYWVQIFTN
ncbi:CAP domain-containing protein [Eubacterium xylanophilum]|uniref:CAP domain-containing protein n=1 Tax=Eubacterium xylanophilum TaxID=39497 RepID=UPI0004B9F76F|nr:CAP domain-containing protein [Eubacterium xylanophilum]